MEEVTIIGMDLAKRSFLVRGTRADRSVAYGEQLSRGKLLSFLASQPPGKVAIGGDRQPALLGPGDRCARPRG